MTVIRSKPPESAPFRQYCHTDESIYQEGFKSGSEWPKHWNHIPGGPYVPRDHKDHHPDWREHCQLLERHRKIWLQGWRDGVKTLKPFRRDLRRLLDREMMAKLAS